jgi:hypothetical protein
MVIENKNFSLRISQLRYITAIIFLPLIVVFLATELVEKTFLGMNKYQWAIVAAALYMAHNTWEYIKEYNYIYFSDEENGKLLLRYVSLRPFNNNKYSIEIQKNNLHSYKIVRHTFKQKLVLYVKTPQGVAKYPPISISALNTDEFNKMKKILNQTIERFGG